MPKVKTYGFYNFKNIANLYIYNMNIKYNEYLLVLYLKSLCVSFIRHECIELSEPPVITISLSNGENMPHKTADTCFEYIPIRVDFSTSQI